MEFSLATKLARLKSYNSIFGNIISRISNKQTFTIGIVEIPTESYGLNSFLADGASQMLQLWLEQGAGDGLTLTPV